MGFYPTNRPAWRIMRSIFQEHLYIKHPELTESVGLKDVGPR